MWRTTGLGAGSSTFLIYTNDFPNISDKLQFFLFADNTNIYFDSENLALIEKVVNEELKKLSLWLNVNRLALNVGKTNFVIFRANKPIDCNVTLIMNKKAVEQKDRNYHTSHFSKKLVELLVF